MADRHPLPADERRAATVDTVIELAGRQNPSEITTAAIAKHMRLTQGALFRHFPSKEDIWRAAMESVADRLLGRIEGAAARTDGPLAALNAIFLAHVEFIAEHPGVPRMIFGELQRPDSSPVKHVARTLLRRYAERVSRVIDEGKARGEISATLDTESAAQLFIGAIQGLVMQSMLAGDLGGIRNQAPRVFAIYRRGIGGAL